MKSRHVERYHQHPPYYCPDDGIGIRVGLRSQILGVRVSLGAPMFCIVNSAVECLPYKEKVGSSILSRCTRTDPVRVAKPHHVWVAQDVENHELIYAKIAHQVEHQFEALGVVGSSPTLGTSFAL